MAAAMVTCASVLARRYWWASKRGTTWVCWREARMLMETVSLQNEAKTLQLARVTNPRSTVSCKWPVNPRPTIPLVSFLTQVSQGHNQSPNGSQSDPAKCPVSQMEEHQAQVSVVSCSMQPFCAQKDPVSEGSQAPILSVPLQVPLWPLTESRGLHSYFSLLSSSSPTYG